MKFVSILAGSIALVTSVGQAQETRKFDPLWSKCKKDTDCVLFVAHCEGFQVVNKKYEQEAQTYFHWKHATAQCNQKHLETAVKPKVSCVKETCVAK